ncbi:MAG: VWA domain-containing protein, partial [Candidatus Aminicenantes bacterium]|nr:VWA domain-containing protein [Candidatus Aminicenantes bacterium]NIT21913.1 VWA domain-containing protein [Candidatus Aminicenantes bacterium]
MNKSIGDPGGVELGIIGFSSNAMNADVGPESGFQLFTSSPQADLNHNNIPDLEEVLRSMDSNQADLPWGGSIELFTPLREAIFGYKTNFKRALERLIYAFATQPEGETKIAFFLSNGFKNEGGPIDEEIAEAAAAGITIHTFGISEFSSVEFLKPIAEGTGGTFTHVLNPSEITTILPGVTPVGISGVTVNG